VNANCARYREDLEAYALGALDPITVRQIEAHLSECRECASIVNAYHRAVEQLALSVPLYRAAPRLKDRVMGGIGAGGVLNRLSFAQRRWAAAAASFALVGLAIGGLVWAIILSSQVERLREDNARLAELTQLDTEQRTALLRLQGDLMSARSEQRRMSTTLEEQATMIILALDPDLIPTELQGTTLAPSAHCNYVWSTDQGAGALTCKGLPTTAFMLTYELWATKGDKTVAVGTFLPRTDGSAQMLVKFPPDTPGPVSNLWVTLEQQQSQVRQRPSSEVVLQTVAGQQAAR
jgi:hypothetical protein